MQKITTCLWFDDNAEQAVNFYCSVFKNSKIGITARYNEAMAAAGKRPVGSVMIITFELEGREFMAINGGPVFKFNESISLMVNCKDQKEIDYYWEKLTADGGQESMCGWLRDKYGLSWQIIPANIGELMGGKDAKKSERAGAALMQMRKIDIKTLEAA